LSMIERRREVRHMHFFDIVSIVLGIGVMGIPLVILMANNRQRQ
jgi:hypothetical protein